jgi:hypothetical protein
MKPNGVKPGRATARLESPLLAKDGSFSDFTLLVSLMVLPCAFRFALPEKVSEVDFINSNKLPQCRSHQRMDIDSGAICGPIDSCLTPSSPLAETAPFC